MLRVDQHNVSEAESKSLTVKIADRVYPLKINESEENDIIEIVEEVNRKIIELQKSYPNRDRYDSVAMALLTFALELKKLRKESTIPKDIFDRIDQIEASISAQLK